jgi:hypothetical protein
MSARRSRCSVQCGAIAAAAVLLAGVGATADEIEGPPAGVRTFLSPMFGWDRDELTVPGGPMGRTTQVTDTAPEYGLFAMVSHPNLVVNNFTFFTRVNEADVWGDFLFANYYADADAPATLNLGAGYLYHRIQPDSEDITVQVPMVKAGPRVRWPALHLTLNPYVGYAWERVDTQHGDSRDDSVLYGGAVHWHWAMLDANVNYYYQDSQDIEPDFQTVRARLTAALNRTWGLTARFDYMEHQGTKDTSFLFGPVATF